MASKAMRRLSELERERDRDHQARRLAWAFLYTLFAFKIGTVAIIWFAASSSRMHDLPFIIATTWYWLLIPAVGMAGPLLYRWRLLRMRRRREQLRGSEWMREHPKGQPEMASLTIDKLLEQHDHSEHS